MWDNELFTTVELYEAENSAQNRSEDTMQPVAKKLQMKTEIQVMALQKPMIRRRRRIIKGTPLSALEER